MSEGSVAFEVTLHSHDENILALLTSARYLGLLPVSVHAPCPRPVNTGAIFLTPVFTVAGPHYQYSRPVDTGRKYGYVHPALAGY